MALGYDGSIRIDTWLNTRGFNNGIKAITRSLKSVGVLIAATFGIGAIVNFGKSAVAVASELASAMTGLKSVLDGQGRSWQAAKGFIDEYIADGLIPANNALKAYQNLALRGYDEAQIREVMTALKDSAAFGRRAGLSMGEAVQTATEGLRNENSILVDNAGVTKNVAKMWDDYAKSVGKTTNELTQAEKIQAEVNGIMEETKFQTGDAAKALQGYAGIQAQLTASLTRFKEAMGRGFIAALNVAIPYITNFVNWLTVLANTFADVMEAIFGVEVDRLAMSTQAAADAQGELAEQTQESGKAAKGALAAFDELNVLQETPEAGAEPVIPILPVAPGDVLPPETENQISTFVDTIREKLQPVSDALDNLKLSLDGLGGTVWEGLQWGWENVIKPIGEWVGSEVAPEFLNALAAGADILNNALIALEPMGKWLWENFLQPIGEWTGELLLDALESLTGFLKDIGDWIEANPKAFETFTVILGSFALAWWLVNAAGTAWSLIGVVAAGATKILGIAFGFLTSSTFPIVLAIGLLIAIIALLILNWDTVKETAEKSWEAIKQAWEGVSTWFKDNVIDPLKGWFSGAWEDIKGFFSGAWDNIQLAWNGASEWFHTNVTDPIKGWFSGAWEDIKGFFSGAWDKVVEIWGGAGEWIKTNVTGPIEDKFSTALDGVKLKWETIWTGIGDFLKTTINNIIGFLNGMLSGIADGINGVIGALNAFSFPIPDWVPGFGGNVWGLSIPYVTTPQIPYLANGAVIPPNSEFLAMLGDNKSQNEILAPEDTIRRIVEEALEGTAQELQLSMPVYLDSEKIYEGQKRVQLRRGKSLATVKEAGA